MNADDLTYEQAREMSLYKWEYLVENPEAQEHIDEIIEAKYGFFPIFACGFCEYFDAKCINAGCPLGEDKKENETDGELCCNDYHRFCDRTDEGDYINAVPYAKKVLQRIKDSPEHEVKSMFVTREQFEGFLKVQASGEMNMMEPKVQQKIGITREQHMYILSNYVELKEHYECD